MQISSRFTLSVHILTCISLFQESEKVTSDFLAGSTNVNPVIVRKLLGQLKAQGLVTVQRGSGGATLSCSPSQITFYDIYRAVECVDNREGLFHFHENPNPECPVGRNIHAVLDVKLDEIEKTLEDKLKTITLEDVAEAIKPQMA